MSLIWLPIVVIRIMSTILVAPSKPRSAGCKDFGFIAWKTTFAAQEISTCPLPLHDQTRLTVRGPEVNLLQLRNLCIVLAVLVLVGHRCLFDINNEFA